MRKLCGCWCRIAGIDDKKKQRMANSITCTKNYDRGIKLLVAKKSLCDVE